MAFGRSPEENPVRKYAGHGAAGIELVHHVLYKGKIGLGLGRHTAVGRKSIVVIDIVRQPLRGKGRIGDYGLKPHLPVLGRGVDQGIFVVDIEAFVMHIVHDHVDSAEVVGGGVALLPIKGTDLFYFLGHPQQ